MPPLINRTFSDHQKCEITVYAHNVPTESFNTCPPPPHPFFFSRNQNIQMLKKQARIERAQKIRAGGGGREERGLRSRGDLIWSVNQAKLTTGSGGGALLLPRVNTQLWTSEWGLTLPLVRFTLAAAAQRRSGRSESGAWRLLRLARVRLKERELCERAALGERARL